MSDDLPILQKYTNFTRLFINARVICPKKTVSGSVSDVKIKYWI